MLEHVLPPLAAERLDALFAAAVRPNQLLPFFRPQRQAVPATYDDWDDAVGRDATWLGEVIFRK
jgi:hypothetical protein